MGLHIHRNVFRFGLATRRGAERLHLVSFLSASGDIFARILVEDKKNQFSITAAITEAYALNTI